MFYLGMVLLISIHLNIMTVEIGASNPFACGCREVQVGSFYMLCILQLVRQGNTHVQNDL